MPSFGVGSIVQGLLTKWEAAQAARYAAWNGASSVPAGVMAIAQTAGSMFKGSSGLTFAGAAGRYIAEPAGPGTMFRDTALAVIEPIRSRFLGGTAHQSYGAGLDFK